MEDSGSTDDAEKKKEASPRAMLAVACSSQPLYRLIVDACSRKTVRHGNGLISCQGVLAGGGIVVAYSPHHPPTARPLVRALLAGHQPTRLLAISEGESCDPRVALGDLVVADRVLNGAGDALRLGVPVHSRPGVHLGRITTPAEPSAQAPPQATPPVPPGPEVTMADGVLAADNWSWQVACIGQESQLPVMAATLVTHPHRSQQSRELAALRRQRSWAGKAGVVTGLLWKQRSALRDVWDCQQRHWRGETELVRLIGDIITLAGTKRR